MLENLHNEQFGKSAEFWHYLVPRVFPEIIRSRDVHQYLCGCTLLFFYNINFICKLFINSNEYANLIISILYR